MNRLFVAKRFLLVWLTQSKKTIDVMYQARKKKILLLAGISYFLFAFFLGTTRIDILFMCTYGILFVSLLLTQHMNLFRNLCIASGISVVWILFANEQYGYNRSMMTIFGLNAFPLFAWALGLFLAYVFYASVRENIRIKHSFHAFFLFVVIYWPLLIFVETIAYHLFNIRNLTTSMYAGLPICDCIHAPPWMQAAYFLLGPLYFLLWHVFSKNKLQQKQL